MDAPPTDWETVEDEVEHGFTVSMPAGWTNRAWTVRRGPAVHTLAHSTSPSRGTSIFLGDPTLPLHVSPGPLPPPPGASVHEFVPAHLFLESYARRRFGRLPDLRLGSVAPCPPLVEVVGRALVASGAEGPWVTAAMLPFAYDEGGRRLDGLLLASTANLGLVWVADVHGVTGEEPGRFGDAVLTMVASRRATPAMQARQLQERAANAAAHALATEELERGAARLRSHHRHAIAGQAAARSAQAVPPLPSDPDDAHRRFLNLVAGERTVVEPNGDMHQVADGFDRYFRRRHDGAWVGTVGDSDLSGLPGVDPTEFEEARIRI